MDPWRHVEAEFRKGNIERAVKDLEGSLAAQDVDRFRNLIGAEFSNPPAEVLGAINELTDSCNRSFDLQMVYLEMNGFDINYERWYFDFFGYAQRPGDPEDLDWLCDWQSDQWPGVTLTGQWCN